MRTFDAQVGVLGRLINAADMRQRVISHNLANVNTPNFLRLDVDFERQLAAELGQNNNVTNAAKPVIYQTPGLLARADGNNVDMDQEIGQMNKNALLQQAYLQLLGTKLNQMRLAIEGT